MIKNPDGTPFQLKGAYVQFDPTDPNYELFNLWDEEAIRIGGSPLYYYEVLIQFQTIDKLYMEDRSKLFSPVYVQLYAYYEPPQQANMSGLFGVDTPDEETVFEFNYRSVLRDVGHPPKVGSRIFSPHRGESWIVIDRKLDQFKGWQALHLQLLCKKFQDTTSEVQVQQPEPNYKVNG